MPPCNCNNAPFSFTRRIPIWTTAKLKTGDKFGGHQLDFRGEGFFVFSFHGSPVPNIMTVQLEDAEITYAHVSIPVREKEVISLDRVRVGKESFVLGASRGYWNTKSKEFEIALALKLDHTRYERVASAFGLKAPLHVQISEKGTFDLKTGRFESAATGVRLDNEPSLIQYRNSKKDCNAYPKLACATAGSDMQEVVRTGGNSQIWICPSHPAEIGWFIDGNYSVVKNPHIPQDPSIPVKGQMGSA